MSIVLIGYRGSGKTTVGQLLARRLGWPCVDSDQVVVERAGKNIKRIFAEDGEAAFRDLEHQVVAELALKDQHVIALGGGALGRSESRKALQAGGHWVIYLRCEAEELLKRIQSDPLTLAMRPNLTALVGGIGEIHSLLAQREPVWREAKTHELDVTHLTPEQAAIEIERAVFPKGQ